ncbi:MAG TPA: hypothetical protein PLD10_16295, partial [Rhodopila sp.]|nr:hypothetical protein [Rhodopila sp.]
LAAAGVITKGKRKPQIKMDERRAISNFHRLVGAEMDRHRGEGILDRTTSFKSVGDIAKELQMSSWLFREICAGTTDPTMSQLMRIAAWMKIPLSELVSRAEKKLKNYG